MDDGNGGFLEPWPFGTTTIHSMGFWVASVSEYAPVTPFIKAEHLLFAVIEN